MLDLDQRKGIREVRKSLFSRIPHVGKPHRPKDRFGSFADMQQSLRERPLPGAKQTYLGQPRVGRRVYGKEPGVRLVWVNWPRLARDFLYAAEYAHAARPFWVNDLLGNIG